MEAEGVEEGGDGGAGVFAGGVEDAVGEGGLLELVLGLGAGVGLEVLVGGDEEAGGAGVDAGVLVVERGDEELRGGEGDVDGAARPGLMRTSSGLSLARSMPAMDWPWTTSRMRSPARRSGRMGLDVVAFDDGVERVDDGFEAVEALDFFDDGGDGGVEGGGAAGDEGGEAAERGRWWRCG